MRYVRHQLDFGRVQLVWSTITGDQTDASIEQWNEELRQLLNGLRERGIKVVHIIDLTKAAPLTPQQRRIQAEWVDRNKMLLRHVTVAFAFVVSSVLMRGVITAINWIKPPPAPNATFTSGEDALTWGYKCCEESGFILSAEQRQEARRLFLAGTARAR